MLQCSRSVDLSRLRGGAVGVRKGSVNGEDPVVLTIFAVEGVALLCCYGGLG